MTYRAGLSREAVVDAAIRIIDGDGLESLSLARLASALGVKSPSLYEHIDGLEDLNQEVRLKCLGMIRSRFQKAALGKSRDPAIRELAAAYRGFAREHPSLYKTTLRSAVNDSKAVQETAKEILDVIYAILDGYGITGNDAVHATRCVRSLLHGFASLEMDGGFGMKVSVEKSYSILVDEMLGMLNSWNDGKHSGRRK